MRLSSSALLLSIALAGCKDSPRPAPVPTPEPDPNTRPTSGLVLVTTHGQRVFADPSWAVVGGCYTEAIVMTDTAQASVPWEELVAVRARGTFRCRLPTGLVWRRWLWTMASSEPGQWEESEWTDVLTKG